MTMKKYSLLSTAIVAILATTATPYLNAEEMSKPKGATGSGMAITGQAKTNQFW